MNDLLDYLVDNDSDDDDDDDDDDHFEDNERIRDKHVRNEDQEEKEGIEKIAPTTTTRTTTTTIDGLKESPSLDDGTAIVVTRKSEDGFGARKKVRLTEFSKDNDNDHDRHDSLLQPTPPPQDGGKNRAASNQSLAPRPSVPFCGRPTLNKYSCPGISVGDASIVPNQIQILTEEEARRESVFARNEPHVRGNWAGLIYLVVRSNQHEKGEESHHSDDEELLGDEDRRWNQWKQQSYDQVCRHWLQSNDDDDDNDGRTKSTNKSRSQKKKKILVVHQEPHLSLSRTFYLQAAFIPSFLQKLQDFAKGHYSVPASITLTNRSLLRLVNDTHTRAFVAWPVVQNHSSRSFVFLHNLVEDINALLKQYQQPPYHDPPIFHATFASMPLNNQPKSWSTLSSSPEKLVNMNNQKMDQQLPSLPLQIADSTFRKKNPSSEGDKNGKKQQEGTAVINSSVGEHVIQEAHPEKLEQQKELIVEHESHQSFWEFDVTRIFCRIGDQIYSFPFGDDDGCNV